MYMHAHTVELLAPLHEAFNIHALSSEVASGVPVKVCLDNTGDHLGLGVPGAIRRPRHAHGGGEVVAALLAGGVELRREEVDVAIVEEAVHERVGIADAVRGGVADSHHHGDALVLASLERLPEGGGQPGVALLHVEHDAVVGIKAASVDSVVDLVEIAPREPSVSIATSERDPLVAGQLVVGAPALVERLPGIGPAVERDTLRAEKDA